MRRQRSSIALLLAVILVTSGLLAKPSAASGGLVSETPLETWVTNGDVDAVARSGNTVYIGGSFTYVGPRSGPFALAGTDGTVQTDLPRPNDDVRAVVPDGAGGWYIGGAFTTIDGSIVRRLAHIRADKTVDPDFEPDPSADVSALALSGGVLYVGGTFTTIGGQTRNRIAALDATTGAVTSWDPNANGSVNSLVVSGSVVYAAGSFTSIGGQLRNRIAALSTSTGTASSWNPNANSSVFALAVSGSTLYAGGSFTSIGGQTRNRIAALSTSTGTASSWNPSSSDQVSALLVSGSSVYAAGLFTSIGGQTRNRIAALSTSTGAASSWNPNADGNVSDLASSGSVVYASGSFTTIGGQTRSGVAALDTTTGSATGWDPHPEGGVSALAVSGTTVAIGGSFGSIGGEVRNRIAALDLTTGALTAWDPNSNGSVRDLAVSGSLVYAGGLFTSIGGQTRNRAAALNTSTGAATSWNPNFNNSVDVVAVSGTIVYLGGSFTTVGGTTTRNRIAAVTTSGTTTSWNPNADDTVLDLEVAAGTVYAGGSFTTIGGQTRNGIAALSSSTGAATSFVANADGSVSALALSGDVLYAGGSFTLIGGQARNRIAALNPTTGTPTGWNPNANNTVRALAASAGPIYAAGYFTNIGGQTRGRLAALDPTTGNATDWQVTADLGVSDLDLTGGALQIGGQFVALGADDLEGVAVFPEAFPPTDIALSNSSVNENAVSNATVGTLFTTDPDAGETHAYGLVTGAGDTDNASFTISGSTLRTTTSFNYESGAQKSIRVRTTDPSGGTYEEALTITVNNVNEAPTDLALSGSSVPENSPSGTTVGTFSTTDPDAGETPSYTLVSGTDSTDNGSFAITGNALSTAATFNFETGATKSIRVRTTDGGGLFFEKALTITVTNVNEAPTNISLSPQSVAENVPVGTHVGTLSSTDPDAASTFTYALVTGAGDTHNASFTISGTSLRTATTFDFESGSSKQVRVRTTDGGGLFFEKPFTITISNRSEPPTDLALSNSAVGENAAGGTTVGTLSTTDPDAGATHTYSLVAGSGDTDNGAFTISGNAVNVASPLDFETNPQKTIRVRTTDNGGLSYEESFTITVTDVNESPTDAALSNDSVNENAPPGTVVGAFSTTDQDAGDGHSYSLVTGAGDTDNTSFAISGDDLQTTAAFDFESGSQKTIRVRTADLGGLFYEEAFTIDVSNLDALSINDVKKREGKKGQSAFVFTITRSGALSGAASVTVATQYGKAKSSDFTAIPPTTINFAGGESTKTVSVLVKGDRKRERTETFTVVLSRAVGAEIVDGLGLGTIKNDD